MLFCVLTFFQCLWSFLASCVVCVVHVSYHLALHTAVEHYAHVSLWMHAARGENYEICDEFLLSSEGSGTRSVLYEPFSD